MLFLILKNNFDINHVSTIGMELYSFQLSDHMKDYEPSRKIKYEVEEPAYQSINLGTIETS